MRYRLLIVEDNPPEYESNLISILSKDPRFLCVQAHWDSLAPTSLQYWNAHLVMPIAISQTDKVISFFQWVLCHHIATPILAILPSEPEEELLQIVLQAADDFLLWPVRREELRYRLSRLLGPERDDLAEACSRLTEEMGLAQLVGEAPLFLRVIEKIPCIAATDSPVLVTGETGTGKELCARAIHHLSKRRNSPFIPVECGAIPDHLFENEVFGHSRGAYTDAHTDQKGLAAMAEGGTLFLDEIDVLSLPAQAKLLRFLEDRTYKPLGGERFVRSDIRLIAAANSDLESCRGKGFRSDLYFRLNVLRLHLPPLRERRGDIALLARHFLGVLGSEAGSPKKSFSSTALRKFETYDWPGNIRELFNVVQAAFLFSSGSQVLPHHISLPGLPEAAANRPESFREARAQVIQKFERLYVEQLLNKHHGNITHAALEAKKDRRTFGRLAKKYGLTHQAL